MIALHHVDKQCVTYILKNTHHIIFDKVSKSNEKNYFFYLTIFLKTEKIYKILRNATKSIFKP